MTHVYLYISMKKEKEKKNDRQTNDSHVATRVKYSDATFLSWF
jgi:hypothetical protein